MIKCLTIIQIEFEFDNSLYKQQCLYSQVEDFESVLPLEAMVPAEVAYKIVEDLDGDADEPGE